MAMEVSSTSSNATSLLTPSHESEDNINTVEASNPPATLAITNGNNSDKAKLSSGAGDCEIDTVSLPYGPIVSPHFYSSHSGAYSKDVRDSKAVHGSSGLYNLGNTCYMNSGLQSLFSCAPLVKHFAEKYAHDDSSHHTLTYHFYVLLCKVWSGQFSVVHPKTFKDFLGLYHSQFEDYRQHDCQEFLAFLLDTLHEQLNVSPQSNNLGLARSVLDKDNQTSEMPSGSSVASSSATSMEVMKREESHAETSVKLPAIESLSENCKVEEPYVVSNKGKRDREDYAVVSASSSSPQSYDESSENDKTSPAEFCHFEVESSSRPNVGSGDEAIMSSSIEGNPPRANRDSELVQKSDCDYISSSCPALRRYTSRSNLDDVTSSDMSLTVKPSLKRVSSDSGVTASGLVFLSEDSNQSSVSVHSTDSEQSSAFKRLKIDSVEINKNFNSNNNSQKDFVSSSSDCKTENSLKARNEKLDCIIKCNEVTPSSSICVSSSLHKTVNISGNGVPFNQVEALPSVREISEGDKDMPDLEDFYRKETKTLNTNVLVTDHAQEITCDSEKFAKVDNRNRPPSKEINLLQEAFGEEDKVDKLLISQHFGLKDTNLLAQASSSVKSSKSNSKTLNNSFEEGALTCSSIVKLSSSVEVMDDKLVDDGGAVGKLDEEEKNVQMQAYSKFNTTPSRSNIRTDLIDAVPAEKSLDGDEVEEDESSDEEVVEKTSHCSSVDDCSSIPNCLRHCSPSEVAMANQAWCDYKAKNDSIVISTFQGQFRSTVFYTRHDISRQLPHKRYATKKGAAFVMNVTISGAFRQFLSEHPEMKIGYTKFASLRPRTVRKIGQVAIETCLCIYCLNVRYKIDALNRVLARHHMEALPSEIKILDLICCQRETSQKWQDRKCIEMTCLKCKDTMKHFKERCCGIMEENVSWMHWGRSQESRKLDVFSKKGNVGELLGDLKEDLDRPTSSATFRTHLFTAFWQGAQYRDLKFSLGEGEAMMVMDFAENRKAFYNQEVKSAHFGKSQITLHPIVLYFKTLGADLARHCLMYLTDDIAHDFHLVHHFTLAALEYAKREIACLKRVYLFSDGCAAQYKGKGSFADLSLLSGLSVQRIYFGSEHGKGEADGETGVLSQSLTRAVQGGHTVIRNAGDLWEWANTNMTRRADLKQRHFFLVNPKDINRDRPERNVITVPGTRTFHQVVCSECNHVSVTYEPFMYLSLPIPHALEQQLCITYISPSKPPVRYLLNLFKTDKIGMAKKKLKEKLCQNEGDIIMAEMLDFHVSRILDDNVLLKYANTVNRKIYAFEVINAMAVINNIRDEPFSDQLLNNHDENSSVMTEGLCLASSSREETGVSRLRRSDSQISNHSFDSITVNSPTSRDAMDLGFSDTEMCESSSAQNIGLPSSYFQEERRDEDDDICQSTSDEADYQLKVNSNNKSFSGATSLSWQIVKEEKDVDSTDKCASPARGLSSSPYFQGDHAAVSTNFWVNESSCGGYHGIDGSALPQVTEISGSRLSPSHENSGDAAEVTRETIEDSECASVDGAVMEAEDSKKETGSRSCPSPEMFVCQSDQSDVLTQAADRLSEDPRLSSEDPGSYFLQSTQFDSLGPVCQTDDSSQMVDTSCSEDAPIMGGESHCVTGSWPVFDPLNEESSDAVGPNPSADVVSTSTHLKTTVKGEGVQSSIPMTTDQWRSCAICLEDLPSSQLLTHVNCDGVFCQNCLDMSVKHTPDVSAYCCPICLQPASIYEDFIHLPSSSNDAKSNVRMLPVCITYRHSVVDNTGTSSLQLLGHPNIVQLPSVISGQALYALMDRMLCRPVFTYSLMLTDGQGLSCSRCPYASHCTGCEVSREGDLSLHPSDCLTVHSSEMLSPDEVSEMGHVYDDVSLEGLRSSEPTTLMDCFRAFTQSEILDEHNPWYCPQCKRNQCAKKTMTVWRYPDSLIIHLKRFVYQDLSSTKVDTKVTFPHEAMDVRGFLSGPSSSSLLYNLYSVVCHFGGASAGHYTSFTKHPLTSQWYYYNDETVSPQIPSENEFTSGYVLFYQRQGTQVEFTPPQYSSSLEENSSDGGVNVLNSSSSLSFNSQAKIATSSSMALVPFVEPPVTSSSSPSVLPKKPNDNAEEADDDYDYERRCSPFCDYDSLTVHFGADFPEVEDC